ncbi:hypothetical protein EVA_05673 [gut metagenome]|uniref:Uncharacterized protein n=1 Tax=gut metagenome TaxID=749906 RepID=J9GGU2_9ZZZZ
MTNLERMISTIALRTQADACNVELSKGLDDKVTSIGHLFRLIVFHAMPEETTFLEKQPSALLRVCNTQQRTADRLLQLAETSISLP